MAAAGSPPLFVLAANTESCFCSFELLHLGHTAPRLERTSASKCSEQSEQMYSKMGMTIPA